MDREPLYKGHSGQGASLQGTQWTGSLSTRDTVDREPLYKGHSGQGASLQGTQWTGSLSTRDTVDKEPLYKGPLEPLQGPFYKGPLYNGLSTRETFGASLQGTFYKGQRSLEPLYKGHRRQGVSLQGT